MYFKKINLRKRYMMYYVLQAITNDKMLLQIYEYVRVRKPLYSCARLINRTHILVDYIINDKCKLRGFRLNATSRIPSLSALFTSRLLGRDRVDVSFAASREIYRGAFITLRCRPLLARYRVKISAALYNLASCMKNLPSRFLARFLPKPPIASHLTIPCDINEIALHENA